MKHILSEKNTRTPVHWPGDTQQSGEGSIRRHSDWMRRFAKLRISTALPPCAFSNNVGPRLRVPWCSLAAIVKPVCIVDGVGGVGTDVGVEVVDVSANPVTSFSPASSVFSIVKPLTKLTVLTGTHWVSVLSVCVCAHPARPFTTGSRVGKSPCAFNACCIVRKKRCCLVWPLVEGQMESVSTLKWMAISRSSKLFHSKEGECVVPSFHATITIYLQ